jgi:HSP20 family protein
MKLTKAPPVALDLKQDIDRFFDRFLSGPFLFPAVETGEPVWSPALDFSESEKEYTVRLEVPAIPRENLDVHLDGLMLTISGHREIRKEGTGEAYFWREREEGRFVRSVRLPLPVDETKVEAICQDGVMTIRLPKIEVKPKNKITIK